MEIELSPETEALIRARVDGGLYLDASDVIRDALRHMVEREHLDAWIDAGEAMTGSGPSDAGDSTCTENEPPEALPPS